jgi:hypothetical protein
MLLHRTCQPAARAIKNRVMMNTYTISTSIPPPLCYALTYHRARSLSRRSTIVTLNHALCWRSFSGSGRLASISIESGNGSGRDSPETYMRTFGNSCLPVFLLPVPTGQGIVFLYRRFTDSAAHVIVFTYQPLKVTRPGEILGKAEG